MSEDVCTCPIRPHMTYEELMDEIVYPVKYCTASVHGPDKRLVKSGYLCPTLLKELDRATKEKRMRKYQSKANHQRKVEKAKKLAKEGLSHEQIVEELRSDKPRKRRKKLFATYRACPIYT